MMCIWTAAIGYVLEEIQIDLNVRLRDQHYALGNLSLNIERGVNKIKGRGHIEPYQVTVPWTVLDPLPKDLLPSYHNTPVSQLPQCTSPISHNTTFSTKNVHISLTKWCIVDICLMHCGVYEMYLFNTGRLVHCVVRLVSNALVVTYWDRGKIAAISTFSWMKIVQNFYTNLKHNASINFIPNGRIYNKPPLV